MWTRVDDGQWYLHIHAREQPDLNCCGLVSPWRCSDAVSAAVTASTRGEPTTSTSAPVLVCRTSYSEMRAFVPRTSRNAPAGIVCVP
jgi:hypothetical protein